MDAPQWSVVRREVADDKIISNNSYLVTVRYLTETACSDFYKSLSSRFKVFLGRKDYWWPGCLFSFTRTDGQAKAHPGGLGFTN